jgi:hypothetical protein
MSPLSKVAGPTLLNTFPVPKTQGRHKSSGKRPAVRLQVSSPKPRPKGNCVSQTSSQMPHGLGEGLTSHSVPAASDKIPCSDQKYTQPMETTWSHARCNHTSLGREEPAVLLFNLEPRLTPQPMKRRTLISAPLHHKQHDHPSPDTQLANGKCLSRLAPWR